MICTTVIKIAICEGVTIDAHSKMTLIDALSPRLRDKLSGGPLDWVDSILIVILEDPLFYIALACGILIGLLLLALVASRTIVQDIKRAKTKRSQHRPVTMPHKKINKSQERHKKTT